MFSFFTRKESEIVKNKKDDINIICKLCHDDIDKTCDQFLSPCCCTGTMALIHKECYNELINLEKICGVCLVHYPPATILNKVISSPTPYTPDIGKIIDETFDKLNVMLYQMDGHSEIKKILRLFSSDVAFFEMISESILNLDDITSGFTSKSKDFIQSGAILPLAISNNDANTDMINNIAYEDSDADDEHEDEYEDELDYDIALDILESLDRLNTIVFDACHYDDCDNYVKYKGLGDNEELTMKKFKKGLKMYYLNISQNGLNYLAKNRCSILKLLATNAVLNIANVINNLYNIVKPNRINNIFGILILESLPFVNYKTKIRWNEKIMNEVIGHSETVESAHIIENTFKQLNHWKINALGYGVVITNILILYGSVHGIMSLF